MTVGFFSHDLLLDCYIIIFIFSFPDTLSPAGVQPGIDYVPALSPASGALDENTRTTCFTFTSLEDNLVEGTENVSVIFFFTNRFGSFFPLRDTATVSITDNDGKLIKKVEI